MKKSTIRERVRKAAAKRRVAVALSNYLRKANPGRKLTAVRVQRLAGGVIKISPVKTPRAK